MKTEAEHRISSLLVDINVGAIGGLIVAFLARKENRDLLREPAQRALST